MLGVVVDDFELLVVELDGGGGGGAGSMSDVGEVESVVLLLAAVGRGGGSVFAGGWALSEGFASVAMPPNTADNAMPVTASTAYGARRLFSAGGATSRRSSGSGMPCSSSTRPGSPGHGHSLVRVITAR
ncbi:hypothetical protein EV193_104535 [Herbihabitans rhizosphaerae]|uniref:Uncharacterized protein n=1 Tax=Herbihabitans rhizosphaerae TaxID=1872711 RepID=A0A4Q7KR26_9PSEU|nr:hypothetical protein EV193_104535 [Herbihabitans rhizosphaerae]